MRKPKYAKKAASSSTPTDKKPAGPRPWPRIVWGDLEDLASVYRFRDFDTDQHKVPKDDVIEHVPSVNCPCQPMLDLANEQKVTIGIGEGSLWVHKILGDLL